MGENYILLFLVINKYLILLLLKYHLKNAKEYGKIQPVNHHSIYI